MKFETKTMDLLTVDRSKYVIGHCISADCAMGAGVVIPIRKSHFELKEACKQYSQSHNKQVVGKTFRYKDSVGVVYNMFTKYSVNQKAGVLMSRETYHKNLKSCLEDLRRQMEENNEKYLALPQIACGLDRCKWVDVEKIIKDVFETSTIEILICIWG